MTEWLLPILTALWKLVEPMIAPLLGVRLGMELQDGKSAKESLKGIEKGNALANSADSLSRADKLRYLESRKRVRNSEGRN